MVLERKQFGSSEILYTLRLIQTTHLPQGGPEFYALLQVFMSSRLKLVGILTELETRASISMLA